ncbi:MAG: ATP-binding protein, partial [Syntrophobacteraceae bacterium]
NEIFPDIVMPPAPSVDTGSENTRPLRLETLYRKPSGEQIHLGYTSSVLQGPGGEPSGWILNFRDLTRLKAIEEHVQQNDRLVFAGRIASEIAHEIKNPLAAMSGAIQLLQSQTDADPFRERLLTIVEREIARINELVTDFLWMAKGSPKPGKIEKVPVCAAIQDIILLLKSRKHMAECHTLRTEFDCSPLLEIDPHHLRQILWNLFINGLEAMREGGELCIGVASVEANGDCPAEIRIDIADTGHGLPEGVSHPIFDPIFTTRANGTGLGLSIVYQLVQKTGGRIEAHSNPSGTGTLFSVFFPA